MVSIKTVINAVINAMLFIVVALSGQAKQDEFPILEGPYLGQEKPGMTPVMFAPGIVSTGMTEAVCCFSPDGKEAYWNIAYYIKSDVKSSIVYSKAEKGIWTKPEFIGFTNIDTIYAYPFLSYDGNKIYFVSNEPTKIPDLNDEYNIWISERNGDLWSRPVPLPFPINGEGIVSGPSESLSGVLYYTLINEKEQAIYRSRYIDGKYSDPVRLPDEVNSTNSQFDGVIAPDESYMILPVANRKDSYGSTDLYVTFRDENDNWTPVINLGDEINTKRVESAARITPDGKYIFLSGLYETHDWSNKELNYSDVVMHQTKPGYGRSDIYWVSAEIIEKLRPGGAIKEKERGR